MSIANKVMRLFEKVEILSTRKYQSFRVVNRNSATFYGDISRIIEKILNESSKIMRFKRKRSNTFSVFDLY
jgi:hypothetical protein